jgi:hypothetical protein
MGSVFEQERDAVAPAQFQSSGGNQVNRLDSGWQRQGDTYLDRDAVISRDRLKSKMLAVPDEWPGGLKLVEHVHIGVVPAVSGAD